MTLLCASPLSLWSKKMSVTSTVGRLMRCIHRSCSVSFSESATAISFTCATALDSRIAITLPPRMIQANATAAAE